MSKDQIIQDLALVKQQAKRLKDQLEASALYKDYQSTLHKQSSLERELEAIELEETKAELMKEFECVTEHKYHHWSHEYLIVHKDCPHIISIHRDGDDNEWLLGLEGGVIPPRYDNYLILGWSDTENGAWEKAIEEWISMSDEVRNYRLGK